MQLPGFVADQSLYQTIKQEETIQLVYKTSVIDDNLIVPQRMKIGTIHCECDPQTDICVCDNGRLIHAVLGDIVIDYS